MSLSAGHTTVFTLDSLLMRTGTLASLRADVARWTTLAGALRGTYAGPEWKGSVAELCTVYYRQDKERFIHTKPYGESTDQITAAADFLQDFMDLNGQWAYLKSRPWYQSGEYVVAVDINYYPDRSDYKFDTAFHKDSGGSNIFVNLIFDNEQTIEATEWFADLSTPSVERAAWQAKLLPEAHLADLAAARKALVPTHADMAVSGGVTEGRHVYVSWVDDLVWHSTPTLTQRLLLTAERGIDLYEKVGTRALKQPLESDADKNFQFFHDFLDGSRQVWISALSVLGSIAECRTTRLHTWLADQGLGPQDLTNHTAPKAWRALYANDRVAYEHDVRERAKTDWRVTATSSESNAVDPNLPGSESIKETPVGLSGRRRVNSTAPEAVAAAAKANEDLPRTFIRTWVRILPATGSKELTDNAVVF